MLSLSPNDNPSTVTVPAILWLPLVLITVLSTSMTPLAKFMPSPPDRYASIAVFAFVLVKYKFVEPCGTSSELPLKLIAPVPELNPIGAVPLRCALTSAALGPV